MSDVCIDTDVASLLQKGRAPDWLRLHLAGQRVWTTFVTVGELWKWAEVRRWGSSAHARLDDWIRRVGVLPYDEHVARAWGRLAAHAQQRAVLVRRTTHGLPRVASGTTSRWSL